MKAAIIDGDVVLFDPSFGEAIVTPIPTTIAGSAAVVKIQGKPVCLEGDEADVQSPGCSYTAGAYVIPGVGTLKIDKLGSDQLTETATFENKKVILKGTTFDAVFEVQTPAQEPQPSAPPKPDTTTSYSGGTGQFVTTNTLLDSD